MRAARLTGVLAEPELGAEQVTQLLPGEAVDVLARDGEWMQVTVPEQPSSKHPAGYPGWVLFADLVVGPPALLEVARGYLRTPYLWGGLSRDGIDCSGLVHVAFRALGVRVPRDADDQHAAAEPVVLGQEQPGDLYFFARPDAHVHHVGFVVEPGVMLHAPDSGPVREVVEEPLRPERVATLVAAGRLG